MNFYDEEITISGPDSKHLSSVQMEQRNGVAGGGRGGGRGGGGGGASGGGGDGGPGAIGGAQRAAAGRSRRMQLQGSSTDDDGLLQDIIDHDDEAEDSDDDDDSDMQMGPGMSMGVGMTGLVPGPRPQKRPGSSRTLKQTSEDAMSSGSDEGAGGLGGSAGGAVGGAAGGRLPHQKLTLPMRSSASGGTRSERLDEQFSMSPDKWEALSLPGELKELFPYILKYTPQTIDTPFHLQPFIPEFVPAVGDVDALLKVQAPPLLQAQRQREMDDHLGKLGLWLLDEPSGTQSEPSLLNMKLRSVLSGSRRRNPRHASSASLIPTARSAKDIDKWISEVEQVHMTQSMFDAQPRKDIDALLEDWPRSFGDEETKNSLDQAYRSCLQQNISLADYVKVLCERFGVEGPLETQADYIHNVQTLFALYLAASQAWE
ncbi:hypothetical protein KR009_010502 [Drosophila setifemur]|nr:hypothetical protein KR009_010502 [Drosophila setifemur]